jgi:transposase
VRNVCVSVWNGSTSMIGVIRSKVRLLSVYVNSWVVQLLQSILRLQCTALALASHSNESTEEKCAGYE